MSQKLATAVCSGAAKWAGEHYQIWPLATDSLTFANLGSFAIFLTSKLRS